MILGISTDQAGVDLTDTIMVASYNPKTQKASLLSIPRDTYTGKTPSRGTAYEKINALLEKIDFLSENNEEKPFTWFNRHRKKWSSSDC